MIGTGINNLIKIIYFCILFNLSLLPINSYADKNTNLEQIKINYSTLLMDIFHTLSIAAGAQSIQIAALDTSSSLNWVFENASYRFATELGFDRIYQGQSDRKNLWQLYYKPIECTILYEKHSKSLRRTVHLRVYLKVVNPEQEIVYADAVSNDLIDHINKNDLKSIENEHLPFTIGTGIKKGGFVKLLQPIIISLLTAGIVYTFDSYRSQ